MKLTKISYVSAVVFGVLSFLSAFLLGLLGMISPEVASLMGLYSVLPFSQVLLLAVSQGVVVYVSVVFSIYIYNVVARKYPISWEVKK